MQLRRRRCIPRSRDVIDLSSVVWLLTLLGACARVAWGSDPGGSGPVVLRFGDAAVVPAFAIANSDDLIYDKASGRIFKISYRSRTVEPTQYAELDDAPQVVAGVRLADGRIALLKNRPEGIIQLSPSGGRAVINLPDTLGTFESIAGWHDGGYLLAPTCATFLGVRVSRSGELLDRFGSSNCSLPPVGLQFKTHSLVFASQDGSEAFTVDAYEGRVRSWDGSLKQVRVVDLPEHPMRQQITADLKASHQGDNLIGLFLYGYPVMDAGDAIVFPGIRSDPSTKVLFSLETGSGSVVTYLPEPGVQGARIVSNGKDAMLIDEQPRKGTADCYFVKLNLPRTTK